MELTRRLVCGGGEEKDAGEWMDNDTVHLSREYIMNRRKRRSAANTHMHHRLTPPVCHAHMLTTHCTRTYVYVDMIIFTALARERRSLINKRLAESGGLTSALQHAKSALESLDAREAEVCAIVGERQRHTYTPTPKALTISCAYMNVRVTWALTHEA